MAPSLDPLLRPRTIAVIGATSRKESLGGKITARLFDAGFTGRVYLVNPKQESVRSTRCYKSVLEVPEKIDLALIIVPLAGVLQAVEDCLKHGVKAVCIITAGFGEIGAEGRALQEKIAALCRAGGARLLGPNCMGAVNNSPAVALDSTFSPSPTLSGPLGFASQSGSLGCAVINLCEERGIGFSQFVSIGNKVDVCENDLLEAWENDDEVPVITLYLESFADADQFLEIARRITPKKPIVLVKAGKTAAGAKAASSHTGALSAGDTGAEALCRQAGIIRADSIGEMLDAALILSRCPLPEGRRVAVLTNAGGPGILAADALAENGLELPALAEETKARLRAILRPDASLANPVDMVASAGPQQFRQCLEILLDDPNIDTVMTITVTPPLFCGVYETILEMLPAFRAAKKTAIAVAMAAEEFYGRARTIEGLPPVFHQPEDAAKALARVVAYAERRRLPQRTVRTIAQDDAAIAKLLAKQSARGGGYLPADDTFRVLEAAGLRVAPWALVDTPQDAVREARRIGYPVVLKANGEAIVHKSDIGGVALNIKDDAALEQAIATMRAKLAAAGHAPDTWNLFLQAFRPGGREVIIGSSRDDSYGPLVMFGLGGTFVEVLKDVKFGLTPMAREDAEEMVRSIRAIKILTGARGQAGVDLDPAIEAIEIVARLVREHSSIVELDVNPLLLYPEKGKAIAVDARIRVK